MGALLTTTVDGDISQTYVVLTIATNSLLYYNDTILDQPLTHGVRVALVDASGSPADGQTLAEYKDALPETLIPRSLITPGQGWVLADDSNHLLFTPNGIEQWVVGNVVHICTIDMSTFEDTALTLSLVSMDSEGNVFNGTPGELESGARLLANATPDVVVIMVPRAVTIHTSATIVAPFDVKNLSDYTVSATFFDSAGRGEDSIYPEYYNYINPDPDAVGAYDYVTGYANDEIAIIDGYLTLPTPLPAGVYLLEVNVSSESYTSTTSIRITSATNVETFDTIVDEAISDHIAMDSRMILDDETFANRASNYTHVRIHASDDFDMTYVDVPVTASLAIVPRDSVQLVEIALNPIAPGRSRSRAAPVSIDYDLSVDNGGSFTILGRMSVRPVVSCFDTDARVQLWSAEPTWCRIMDLQPGARIMTINGQPETVVSVRMTPADDIDLVHVPAGSLGHGVPARDLCITPSHFIILHGMVHMRAERLVHQSAKITRIRAHAAVCHVQTREPCFMIVDGIVAESWVGPNEEHARMR